MTAGQHSMPIWPAGLPALGARPLQGPSGTGDAAAILMGALSPAARMRNMA